MGYSYDDGTEFVQHAQFLFHDQLMDRFFPFVPRYSNLACKVLAGLRWQSVNLPHLTLQPRLQPALHLYAYHVTGIASKLNG